MTQLKSEFLNILQERGYIHQVTDLEALDKKMSEGPISAYIGFDCTAPSLHVGSLVQIMMLRWLQKTGNKPIVLMGGGTSKIGDPSGRDESRQLMTDEIIQNNLDGIFTVFNQLLEFGDGKTDAKMVNNDDWLSSLSYIPFLREIGPHFTINRMMTFDSVKLRLDREQPLTFLEFNYMILQAYDFMELAKRESVSLQMGGSDQWGNIVNGMELARRMGGGQLFGLTTPLMTTSDGKKMGKTANGAVWLNEAQLPAYDYWQFWRNTTDADVGRFLRLFTELPMDEIARLEALEGREINDAKIILANEATKLCRGLDAAKTAEATAKETFEKGGAGADLPTINVSSDTLNAGINIIDLFVQAGLGSSKGEVRRLIKQGGAKLNDVKVDSEEVTVAAADIADGQIKLSAGKKRHALVKPE
ncbi:tyrosine--tRNA ligase [Kordiimonas sp. SCSIO 12603]|uniref:tyrosine--tRNA ligase n=1 Tax=Kordiimonas sp. SCSIO 12603 TaxID=2829596 RepID=UPI0021073B26|nr:tyrosine--tRNA ligase [Kordiimonas sp. SCSIO 12603]UTW57328.1 tyrosine--tRNA ligase [Kordiimonas sp. SCSIO 12603]